MAAPKTLFLVSAICTVFVEAEVVPFQKCYLGAKSAASCAVHEVRVSPCPEAVEGKPCKVSLPINITFGFDFTPAFSATKLGSAAYKVDTLLDVPYDGLDSDGCKFTTCPLVADKRHEYSYSFNADVKLPSGTKKNNVYTTKLKLWNEEDYHQQCCIKMKFELV